MLFLLPAMDGLRTAEKFCRSPVLFCRSSGLMCVVVCMFSISNLAFKLECVRSHDSEVYYIYIKVY